MIRARVVVAIAVAEAAASCATVRPPQPRPARRAMATAEPGPRIRVVTRATELKRPSGTHRGFPVWMPELVSPELGPYYERLAAKFDPRSWYLWLEQAPPGGFRGLRKTGKFPGGAFATVRAYEFGYDRAYPNPSLVDGSKKGCGSDALAADGTLCPSVVAPGVTLSQTQSAELFAIVNERDEVPRVVMNGYNFAFSFVAFDVADKPVAEVSVDYSGIKLWSQPRQTRDPIDTMSAPRRQRMRELLVEVGFKVSEGSDLEKRIEDQRKLDGEQRRARFLPVSSGIAPELRLDRTTNSDRDRLCTWKELLFLLGSPRSDGYGGGSGLECNDGVRVLAMSPSECRRDFPQCSATVGEVDACLRHMRFDGCFEEPSGAACLKLRPCLWGMDWSLAPPQPEP